MLSQKTDVAVTTRCHPLLEPTFVPLRPSFPTVLEVSRKPISPDYSPGQGMGIPFFTDITVAEPHAPHFRPLPLSAASRLVD
ncbi:hypothetical protein M3J09_013438 [Ascochyta lentis]